jgi:hypothetical protein
VYHIINLSLLQILQIGEHSDKIEFFISLKGLGIYYVLLLVLELFIFIYNVIYNMCIIL